MVSEEQMQAALSRLNDPNNTWSLRKIAKEYGVPRSSLQNRQNGIVPHSEVHRNQMRLSPEQEQWLARWIIEEDRKGLALLYHKVEHMASLICHGLDP